ncbi:hypothetical protein KCU81_g9475, partial [Aureobasidium melanogenum]|uniref:Uncharacterized protein n=1 Tax=Aureobasidium melanogenum (strain CBS 110374) TaxID=1043003 RepID=A0A074VIT2_AURM1
MRCTTIIFATLGTVVMGENIFQSLFSVATSDIASVYGDVTSKINPTTDTQASIATELSSLGSQYSSLASVTATATGSALQSLSSEISSLASWASDLRSSASVLAATTATHVSTTTSEGGCVQTAIPAAVGVAGVFAAIAAAL